MSNVLSFTGTLGRDCEQRFLPSGQSVLNFTVANNIGFGDKQQTLWIRCALWGKRGEGKLQEFLVKGTQVFVSGELTQSEYTKDGATRTQLELNCNVVDLVGKKGDGGGQQQSAPQQRQQQKNDESDFSDDIPF